MYCFSAAARVANVFEASRHPLKVYTTVTKGYTKTRAVKVVSIAMYCFSVRAESRKPIQCPKMSAEIDISVDSYKEDVQGS